MGVHRFDLPKLAAVAPTTARRPHACAIAGTFTVLLATCLLPLPIGAAEAKSRDEGGRGALLMAMADLDRTSSTLQQEQVDGIVRKLILAQRVDKAQPAEAQPVRGPAAAGPDAAPTAMNEAGFVRSP